MTSIYHRRARNDHNHKPPDPSPEYRIKRELDLPKDTQDEINEYKNTNGEQWESNHGRELREPYFTDDCTRFLITCVPADSSAKT